MFKKILLKHNKMRKIKYGLIIQARVGSKRLKNKVLRVIFGKTVLQHVLDRSLNAVKNKKKIILATTNLPEDKILFNFAKKNDILCYRGSSSDVAERMMFASELKKFDYFVRICADSPFIDPKIIKKGLSLIDKKFDIITNVFPKKILKGQSVEIVKTSSLKKIIEEENLSSSEKEHMTSFFYNNYRKYKIKTFKEKSKLSYLKNLSIDCFSDIVYLKKKLNKEKIKI